MLGAAEAAVGLPKQKAACSVAIGCGTISFYTATVSADARFEAVCHDPDHEHTDRCRWTKAPSTRPLGYLAMWLGIGPTLATHEEHNDDIVRLSYLKEDKQHWRDVLRAIPNGERLMSFERQLLPGEPEESD